MGIFEFDNGSKIEAMCTQKNTVSSRGELVRAIEIKRPEHIELSSVTHPDRVEFIAINTATNKESTRSFYIREDESPAMSTIKKLRIIDLIIEDVL